MERVKERLLTAGKALRSLAEILKEPRTAIVRDASIQRFEYSFEAVWKAAQLYLREVEAWTQAHREPLFARACKWG